MGESAVPSITNICSLVDQKIVVKQVFKNCKLLIGDLCTCDCVHNKPKENDHYFEQDFLDSKCWVTAGL